MDAKYLPKVRAPYLAGEPVKRTSAYIDINAWKAGMAERLEGYRWCSFAAAVRGDSKAGPGPSCTAAGNGA